MSDSHQHKRVIFLGGGNMAASLISGMVESGFSAKNIQVAEPNAARAKLLASQYRVQVSAGLSELDFSGVEALILAVKPQVLLGILSDESAMIPEGMLVISIAAGITCEQIASKFSKPAVIVRCMPNTPAMVGAGISAMFKNQKVNQKQSALASEVLACVGEVMWVDNEHLLNGVTAVSGSGPAYFFYLMEGLIKGGISAGLTAKQSETLVLQTALGAAKLALCSEQSVQTLRKQVTSKGGTTEAGIHALDEKNAMGTVTEAVQAAFNRSVELSKE